MRLISIFLALFLVASPVIAQSQKCSSRDVSRLSSAFRAEMNSQASTVVWFGSDKSVNLKYCDKYSDGFVVSGRFHMYGTDGAYYWLDGKMTTNRSYGPKTIQVTNANANFQTLAVIKGGIAIGAVVAACSASGDCS